MEHPHVEHDQKSKSFIVSFPMYDYSLSFDIAAWGNAGYASAAAADWAQTCQSILDGLRGHTVKELKLTIEEAQLPKPMSETLGKRSSGNCSYIAFHQSQLHVHRLLITRVFLAPLGDKRPHGISSPFQGPWLTLRWQPCDLRCWQERRSLLLQRRSLARSSTYEAPS